MAHTLMRIFNVLLTQMKIMGIKIVHGNRFLAGKLPYFIGKVIIEMDKNSKLHYGNHVKIQNGTRIGVRKSGKVQIGDRCSINIGTLITCHNEIVIGEYTQIGPYCQIYDHDHNYYSISTFDAQEFNVAPVKIGSHVWLGGGCIILKGSTIGDNCVVAAGSVVKGNIPANSMVYCKKEQVIKPIIRN